MASLDRHSRNAPTCSILPPYLLQGLAQSDEPRVARAAARSLILGQRVVARRETRGAHRRAQDQSRGAGGLIPDALRERARRELPQPRPGQAPDRGPDADAGAATPAPHRSVHDAHEGTDLPGDLMRAEGGPPVQDESVNEAYDGLGATWTLFQDAFGRNSLDGQGLPMIGTVHYEKDFDNAYWDGEQMVFGDGDGVYFNSFTDDVDVIGHELTHGVTQFTAGLVYVGQPGALNESVSDVFGALVKQQVLGQSADQADWLIGEHLFTDKVHGVALRSMKSPGTAYDDPVLGKDPQPADMDGFVVLPHDERNDNGGVHINSGIPNRAFYLAATAIGGNAWDAAGLVWYDVLTGGSMPKDVDFAGFAGATIAAAKARFPGGSGADSDEVEAIKAAWRTVKVDPA